MDDPFRLPTGAPEIAATESQREMPLALFHVATQLSADLDAPDGAGRAAELVVESLPGVDAALLWLVSPHDGRLELAAVAGSRSGSLRESLGRERIAAHGRGSELLESLASGRPQVLESPESYLADLESLGGAAWPLLRFARELGPALRVTRLPLRTGRTAVGVLELVALQPATMPLLDDLALLQAFADQLAVALRNAQLYAQTAAQQQRLEAFDAIVAAIASSGELQLMLERVLPPMLQLAGARDGLIAVVDEGMACVAAAGGALTLVATRDDRLDPEGAVLGEANRSGHACLQRLDESHPWAVLRDAALRSLGVVPLVAGASPVGYLVIGVADDRESLEQWAALEALGTQIAVAILNLQLYSASQRERQRLGSVIASLNEGVIICDRLGRLILANRAASAIVGHALEDLRSRTELAATLQMRTLQDELLPFDSTPLARCLQGESFIDYELAITRGSGERAILSCSGAPLIADDGTIDGGVIVFRDMTAQKQHEASRDEFLAVAAHELRAPLAAIKGYTDLLVQRESQRPDATDRDRRGIQMLSRQIDHLVRLVDNLLNMSRLDAGRFDLYLQPVDLITLIEASIDRVSIGDANHEFVFRGAESLPITCDQLRMQQVFTNLLSNAARYSPAGTQITVEVWTEPCTIEGGVVVAPRGSDMCVVVAVRDQGVGMAPEVQARVFDRYYRANTLTSASGLGLGVYITREIVLRHGGRIWLESAPGSGTTFYVMLPVEQPATRQE
jgi:two-component system, OmpR family, phosphate regulon sensor histidine kinase PhoR